MLVHNTGDESHNTNAENWAEYGNGSIHSSVKKKQRNKSLKELPETVRAIRGGEI